MHPSLIFVRVCPSNVRLWQLLYDHAVPHFSHSTANNTIFINVSGRLYSCPVFEAWIKLHLSCHLIYYLSWSVSLCYDTLQVSSWPNRTMVTTIHVIQTQISPVIFVITGDNARHSHLYAKTRFSPSQHNSNTQVDTEVLLASHSCHPHIISLSHCCHCCLCTSVVCDSKPESTVKLFKPFMFWVDSVMPSCTYRECNPKPPSKARFPSGPR